MPRMNPNKAIQWYCLSILPD